MLSKDWWELLNKNIVDLRYLVTSYHPNTNIQHNHTITAHSAESACQYVRNLIHQDTNILVTDRFDMAVLNHDAEELMHLFNSAWFGMPESYESRREPGFYTLCDLCEGIEEE